MPIRRKRYIRRRVPRRVMKRMRKPRPSGLLSGYNNPTHKFKRTINFANISPMLVGGALIKTVDNVYMVGNNTAPTTYGSFALYFTLGDLPDYNEFTTLFDRYKIVAVKVSILPYANMAGTANAVTGGNSFSVGGMWHIITDYDDASVPTPSDTGVNYLREYTNYKCQSILKPIRRTIKPRIAMATYASGAFSSYANMKSQWIDSNSPSVQHYGIKAVCEINNTANVCYVYFKCEYTMYLEAKDLR